MKNMDALEVAKLNPELEDFVLSKMPESLSKAEKVVYIYSKLCLTLNYDPEYAASGRANSPKQVVHANIDYVKTVSPTNTDVICYDFNTIFGKFLKKLDINFEIKGYSEKSSTYGNHSDVYVYFTQDDTKADFQENFGKVCFQGHTDMKHMKVDGKILTNADIHSSPEFQAYFSNLKQNIVSLVKEQDQAEKQAKKAFESDEAKIKALESEFLLNCPDFAELDEKESVEMFVSQVKNVDMNRFDALFYINKIFKNTMPESKDKIFTYSVLREKSKDNPNLYQMISVFNIASDTDDFFLKITPPNQIKEISQENLQNAFDKGEIDYIPDMLPENAVLPHIKSLTVEDAFCGAIALHEQKNQMSIKKVIEKTSQNDGDFKIFPDKHLYSYITSSHLKLQGSESQFDDPDNEDNFTF